MAPPLITYCRTRTRIGKETIKKLLKRIMKTSNPEKTAAYTISWHVVKLYVEKKFSAFENESELSEGNFVVKIWESILEVLFSETCMMLRWGDTLSQVAQEGEMAIASSALLGTQTMLVMSSFGRRPVLRSSIMTRRSS